MGKTSFVLFCTAFLLSLASAKAAEAEKPQNWRCSIWQGAYSTIAYYDGAASALLNEANYMQKNYGPFKDDPKKPYRFYQAFHDPKAQAILIQHILSLRSKAKQFASLIPPVVKTLEASDFQTTVISAAKDASDEEFFKKGYQAELKNLDKALSDMDVFSNMKFDWDKAIVKDSKLHFEVDNNFSIYSGSGKKNQIQLQQTYIDFGFTEHMASSINRHLQNSGFRIDKELKKMEEDDFIKERKVTASDCKERNVAAEQSIAIDKDIANETHLAEPGAVVKNDKDYERVGALRKAYGDTFIGVKGASLFDMVSDRMQELVKRGEVIIE